MRPKYLKISISLCLIVFMAWVSYAQVRQFRYSEAIKSGNTYYQSGDYINAKVAFQLALRMKSGDAYAQEMITLTLDLIKGQTQTRKLYTDLLVQADEDFKNLKLELAKKLYLQALNLFPYEKYPKKQVERIDLIILENIEIIKDNEAAIIEGDRLFALGDYENAMVEFQYALGLIPGQEYPKERLKVIRRILAGLESDQIKLRQAKLLSDSLLARKDTIAAKEIITEALEIDPGNSDLNNQLIELNAQAPIAEQIIQLSNEAASFINVGDLFNAERKLRDALLLDPENESLRIALSKVEEDIESKRTTSIEDYENAIRQGNKLMIEGRTEEAKQFYDFAARLRPTQQNPLSDSIFINKRSNIEQLSEDDIDYQKVVQEALIQLKNQNLSSASQLLLLADSIKAQEGNLEPDAQYDSIKLAIQEQNNSIQAFDQYLIEADQLLKSKLIIDARHALNQAEVLINQFTFTNSQLDRFETLKRQVERQEAILKLLNEAKELKVKGDFTTAKQKLIDARALDPTNPFISNSIIEMDRLLADEAVRDLYLYNQALKEAELLLNIEDFNAARVQLTILDSLHLKQIPEHQKYATLDSIFNDLLIKARKRYEDLIVNGDYFYRAREFDKALQAYVDARELFPNEPYPIAMIGRITQQFTSKTIQTLLQDSVSLRNFETYRIPFEPIDIANRRDIYFYLKLKNVEQVKNLKVIFNYGKDQQKNGGVIVRLIESNLTTDYLVRVGNQYRWFSEDNNWISLQAEGGTVELHFCSITQAE